MSWPINPRPAKCLITLKEQIDANWSDRDKSSDGLLGDAAHASRKSDHNPWVKDSQGVGVVTAMDIDRELARDGSVTVATLVARLQASRDPRIKYIIWNGQITVPGDITQWKPYHGINAHKHHMHISVSSNPKLYDDDRDWQIGSITDAPTAPLPRTVRDLKRGDKGGDVKTLQERLNVLGYNLTADGDFGPATERSVQSFQNTKSLRPDGIVGANTRHELGL